MEVLKSYEKVPCARKPVFPVPMVFYTQLFLLGNVLKSLETKYEDKNMQNVAAALAWWISLLYFCPLPKGEPLHLAPGGQAMQNMWMWLLSMQNALPLTWLNSLCNKD